MVEVPLMAFEKRTGEGEGPEERRRKAGYTAREVRRAIWEGRSGIDGVGVVASRQRNVEGRGLEL